MPTIGTVPLPSKGLVYPIGSALHKKDSVEIREMSAQEEDLLTSLTLIRTGKTVDAVIGACLITKDVDPSTLLMGDRNSIVIGLVLASYGSIYEADVRCDSCGEMNKKYQFNINDLPVKYLAENPLVEGANEFPFVLPKTGKSVTFKLTTAEDEKEIQTIAQRLKSAANREANVTTRLKKIILSVDGERDTGKIAEFIDRKLPIMDSLALKKHIDKISPNVETAQLFTCSHCGYSTSVDMPIDFNFFWRAE